MSNSKLITPWLPENLESLHKHEEELRTKSILEINADQNLKDQFIIIQESLNMIFDVTKFYKTEDKMELTIQYIGARFFNSIVTAIKLMLSGYYQSSVMLQRDIVEIGFLLDYFLSDKSKIEDWKKSSTKERMDQFSPASVRKALDDRDSFQGKKRQEIYKLMSEVATHPTYAGFKLLAPDGQVHLGPFFHVEYLKHLVHELALRVPHFAVVYIRHFENLPSTFLKVRVEFLAKIKNWAQKYLKSDLSHLDINGLQKQVEFVLDYVNQLK
jgi:hypothetical protein